MIFTLDWLHQVIKLFLFLKIFPPNTARSFPFFIFPVLLTSNYRKQKLGANFTGASARLPAPLRRGWGDAGWTGFSFRPRGGGESERRLVDESGGVAEIPRDCEGEEKLRVGIRESLSAVRALEAIAGKCGALNIAFLLLPHNRGKEGLASLA